MVDFEAKNYENKLARLGKKYESMKREADTKKGALLNTVENMKAEHGIETADEAKAMITELETKVHSWEVERDELVKQIETAIDGGGRREDGPLPSRIDSLEDKYDEFLGEDSFDADDDFEDFEAN